MWGPCKRILPRQKTDPRFNNWLVRLMSSRSTKDDPVNAHAWRTHTCGELTVKDVGLRVTLCGWLQFVRMDCFATLRDAYGTTQILTDKELLSQTPLESVLVVEGEVRPRPEGQANKNMPTGEVEIAAEKITVVNAVSSKLPFTIRDHNKANESLRMKHRYLDLRFPEMQNNLRLRSRVLTDMRQFLVNKRAFVEVETPTLFRKTPGGAQEFIVPTQKPGKFFSLVQSPQQLKQLLMVGGIDRYFQIARCYRDETSRPDRQPEFTQVDMNKKHPVMQHDYNSRIFLEARGDPGSQLDIEMSFTDSEGVVGLTEDLLAHALPSYVDAKPPFERLSLQDSIKLYGTDKPDLTMTPQLQDLTPSGQSTADNVCRAVVIPSAAALLSNPDRIEVTRVVKSYPSCKLLTLKFPGSDWDRQLSKIPEGFKMADIRSRLSLKEGDLVYIAYGPSYEDCSKLLGKLRVDTIGLFRRKKLSGRWDAAGPKYRFVWIMDFPLFELVEDGTLSSTHHPFTAPHPEDEQYLDTDPLRVRGLHYDLVMNGWEIGGGSVRIHDAHLQLHVIKDILGLDPSSMNHLITALGSGAPPHAGIALGLDRLISILVGAASIRDVIAFPKTSEGHDPLSGAPSSVDPADLQLYHIQAKRLEEVESDKRTNNLS